MTTLAAFIAAAFLEIAGCFAFWAVLRLKAHSGWLLPGVFCLLVFAWLLARIEADLAGRVYAAYGGIYIVASLVWLWSVEGRLPDRWDTIGSGLCLLGAALIFYGPRGP